MDKKPEVVDLIEDYDWIKKEDEPLTNPKVTQPNNSILVNSNLTSQAPTNPFVPPYPHHPWYDPYPRPPHHLPPWRNPFPRPHPPLPPWENPFFRPPPPWRNPFPRPPNYPFRPRFPQPYNIPTTPPATQTPTTRTELKRAKTTSVLGNKLFERIAKDEKVDVNVLTVEYKGVKYGVSGIVMPILMSRLVPIDDFDEEDYEYSDGDDEAVEGEVSSSQCSLPSMSPVSSTSSCPSYASNNMTEAKWQHLVGLLMKMVDMYQPKTLADWKKMREDFNQVFSQNCCPKTLSNLANYCRNLIRETERIQPWDLEVMNRYKNDEKNRLERLKRKKDQEMTEQMSKKSKPDASIESIKEIQNNNEAVTEELNIRTAEEKSLKEQTDKERVEKMVLEILNRENAEKEKVDAEARKAEAAKRRLEFVKKKREQLLAKSLEPPKFNFLLKQPEK